MRYKTTLPKSLSKALETLIQFGVISEKEYYKFGFKYLARKQTNGIKPKVITSVYEISKIDRGIDQALLSNPTADIGQLIQAMKNADNQYYDITKSKVYHRLQYKVDTGLVDKVKVDGSNKVLYAKRHIPINNK